uniref:transglutaminase domain-containing protein n=1 Tax=Endozoicomonas atrinae TaxID=1333660 RepID=UPI001930E422
MENIRAVPGSSKITTFVSRPSTSAHEERISLLSLEKSSFTESTHESESGRRSLQSFHVVTVSEKKPPGSANPVKFDCVIMPPDKGVAVLLKTLSDFEYRCSQHGEVGAEIHLIQSLADLSKDNLRQRIHLSEYSSECERSLGKLFENDRPIKLVIDLQEMSPSDTVALNDLLDPENPALNKTRLGAHVEILVLVQRTQFHAGSAHSLGADTCRRLNRVENTWDYEKKLAQLTCDQSSQRPLLDFAADDALEEGSLPPQESAVDLCDGHLPWRPALYGSYGIKSGRCFGWNAGVIEQEKPHTLWITGAPEEDLTFTQALRNIKITREIEANGKKILLPREPVFKVRQPSPADHLRLQESVRIESHIPDGQLITINSANLNSWLSDVGIDSNGVVCEHHPLEEAIRAGGTILVTSSLREAQWNQLLHKLKPVSEKLLVATGQNPPMVLLELNQPETFFGTGSAGSPPFDQAFANKTLHQAIKVQRSQNLKKLIDELHVKHPEAEIVRINTETTLAHLLNNAHITSESSFRYGFRPSRMMEALRSNKPVILCGLEQNPRLQLELETLFSKPGYFFINSGKEQIPADARIYLVWPETAKTESVLWQAAIDKEATVITPLPENSQDQQRLKEGMTQLQQAFNTLPGHFSTIQLPELSDALIQSVNREASDIVTQEGGTEILPIHYRKAISRLVIHVTRENKQVIAFMKSAVRQIWPDNKDRGYWIDIDRLTAFLGDGHLIDREYIASRSWELIDMFGEQFFKTPAAMVLDYKDSGHMETLIALICHHAPKPIQRTLKVRLKCDSGLSAGLPQGIRRSSVITKILHNALYSGWAFRGQQDLPDQVRLENLSARILDIQNNTPPKKHKSLIRTLLEDHFIGGQQNPDQPVTSLLNQILSSRIDQGSGNLRRQERLKERIRCNRLITIEGGTGTGKSYLAHQAAKSLGPTVTLTIGPSAEERLLLKRWVWQKQGNDRTMKEQEGIILNWAKTEPRPDEFVTLVVDEANLAATLLDNVLAGIWSDKPHIFCCSEKVEISPRHRVIFTCNPSAYAGRSSQMVLQGQGPRVHYPPLTSTFLRDQVVLPALSMGFRQSALKGLDDSVAQRTADTIMALQEQLKSLVTDRIFSPRDLTDVCSWMAWQLHYKTGRVSQAQLNEMVWCAFDSALGHSLNSEVRESYLVLREWFKHRYGFCNGKRPAKVQSDASEHLEELYRRFCGYVGRVKPGFNTSSQSVKSLMQALVQDLDRLDLECGGGLRHPGRRASLVEGPAGRGKDATLKLLLDMWLASDGDTKPGARYFNAGDCEWPELKTAIREAQREGTVLIISELNLISSADLEGELNDVLTEPCTPGFHLFATTNPPEYSGRNAFSPALKDRFRFIRIDDYSEQELCKIAQQILPPDSDDQIAEHIAALHCYIDQQLKSSKQALFPVCRDLQNLAADVTESSDLIELFAKHYFLYLQAGKITKERLVGVLQRSTQPDQEHPISAKRCWCDHDLCGWLFKTIPSLDTPLFIQRTGSSGHAVTAAGRLSVAQRLSDDEAKAEIIRQVAEWLWKKETGMPTEMGERRDIQTRALYVLQKRQWFCKRLKDSPIPASDVFKLDRGRPDPSPLPVSASHGKDLAYLGRFRDTLSEREIWERLLRSDLRVEIDKTKSTPVWQSCVKTFCLPLAVVSCLPCIAIAIPTRAISGMIRAAGTRLDTRVTTVRETSGTTQLERRERTFHAHDINHYRLKFIDYKVTDNGNIDFIKWDSKEKDLTRVFPEKMNTPSEDGTVELWPDEVYGCHTIQTGSNKKLFPLPSKLPREEMTKLRTVPEHGAEVFLDNYTGQHWIRFSGLNEKENIQVHYQLRKKTGGAGPFEQASVDKAHKSGYTAVQEASDGYDCCEQLIPSCLNRRNDEDESAEQTRRTCPETIRTRVENMFDTVRRAEQDPSLALTDKQQLILNILNAGDDNARIEAAAEYCRHFDNESNLQIRPSDDLAQILLSEGVGSCRHRTPPFIFILQYFGITCRAVHSEIHAWAEVWNGRDWKTYDLGGASSGRDTHGQNPHFPNIRERQYSAHTHSAHTHSADSLAVLAPRVIEHFKKASTEGIEEGCELLSRCKQYGTFFGERWDVEAALLESLNKMAESDSNNCQTVLKDIEYAHDSLDERDKYDSSTRAWVFFDQLLSEHLDYCIKNNVTNTEWLFVLTDFIIEKGWLAPKEQIKIDFFRNLRQWRWVEKNIPSLKTLASKNIKEWY